MSDNPFWKRAYHSKPCVTIRTVYDPLPPRQHGHATRPAALYGLGRIVSACLSKLCVALTAQNRIRAPSDTGYAIGNKFGCNSLISPTHSVCQCVGISGVCKVKCHRYRHPTVWGTDWNELSFRHYITPSERLSALPQVLQCVSPSTSLTYMLVLRLRIHSVSQPRETIL